MAWIDDIAASAPTPSVVRDYQFPSTPEVGPCSVRFVRVDRVPGFSHAAIANGQRVGYLSSDDYPSIRAARYFWAKWAERVMYGTVAEFPPEHPVRGDLGTVPPC